MVEVPAERPIIFLGSSMSLADAKQILNADYRRPIMRGDLGEIAAGKVVGIIDGFFEQSLSVSPSEVSDAVSRGVKVFGGASMGALRAAEIPGMIGVGRIFSWYRDGIITRDDEVALLLDDVTYQSLTVPTVNVRFAVERLCRPGTIDRATADSLLAVALTLPFKRRTYPAIVKLAGLADRPDCADLIRMLQAYDLKYLDARELLEVVDRHVCQPSVSASASGPSEAATRSSYGIGAPDRVAKNSLLIWESGDRVTDYELFKFLALTGKLETYVQSAMSRHIVTSVVTDEDPSTGGYPQMLFNQA
ncbi:MAG: TfuA-like protein, partial [Pseudonocardiaceae bacterium]